MAEIAKPRIKLNTHRSVPLKWRCVIGRYNGYADNMLDAYRACLRRLASSKYWEQDVKRIPGLLAAYNYANQKGFLKCQTR